MSDSKRACQLSVRKLALVTGATESYLHTFTFADPEPSQREAQKRFRSFRTGWAARHGKKFVWSIQRGSRTNRIHFHLVTTDRWDAKEMWAVLPRYGFGRYDVQKPKPIEFADYIARYVARGHGLEPKSRTWGCVGFKGVRCVDVDKDEILIESVVELPQWLIRQLRRISLNDEKFARRKSFVLKRWSVPLVLKMANALKKHQETEVVAEAQIGTYPVLVGEYRGFTLRATKTVDKLSKVEISRVIVEHTVLAGTETIRLSEFLPPGSDGAAVKPAAEAGEMVVVRVGEWRRNPQTNQVQLRGFIKPLSSLPLTPAGKP